MQPDEWISVIANSVSYWDEIEPTWTSINQSYCDRCDDEGLEAFHDAALQLCTEPSLYERIKVKDTPTLQSQIDKLVDNALTASAHDPKIKAIYFEYVYSGGPWAHLEAFLCLRYSSSRIPRESDWPAFFEQSIEGPNVAALLAYDPDGELSEGLDLVAGAYIDAVILAAIVRSIQRRSDTTLPFGFARHDHPVVHIKNCRDEERYQSEASQETPPK